MKLLKLLEVLIRKLLLRVLRGFSRRRATLPPDWDFSSSKFLFIRQDRIGDVLVSTPVFHALRGAFPNATIDVLLSPNNYMALETNSFIRRRWIYRKNLIAVWTLLRELRREKYDFVIDLMDNPSATSTILAICAGGKWNVGLDKGNAYAYDIVVPLLSRKDVHIVDRLAEMLPVFGIEPPHEGHRIWYETSEESDRHAHQILEKGRCSGHRIIAINISAGSETRFWGIENYRQLIARLQAGDPTSCFVLLHKPDDESRAREIGSQLDRVIIPPKTSFDGFAALIRQSHVLITPDTAAAHLAAAFNIPSIVLYVQSDPNLRIWDPYKSLSECLVTPIDDLTTIGVSEVVEAYARLGRKIARGAVSS